MSEPCAFCGGPVNPHDAGTHKQVAGWVHGRGKDGMTLREDTGKYAHDACIVKAKSGQAADQPSMFDDLPEGTEPRDRQILDPESGTVYMPHGTVDKDGTVDIEDLFEEVAPPPTIAGLGEMLGLAKPKDGPAEGSFKSGFMKNPVVRCDAYSRKGTGFGTCDFPLDEHGNCARAGHHVVDF